MELHYMAPEVNSWTEDRIAAILAQYEELPEFAGHAASVNADRLIMAKPTHAQTAGLWVQYFWTSLENIIQEELG